MSETANKQLPENWEWSTLGDVCEHPQYGWTTKASQEGNLHILRTTDITSGQINWDTVPYCVEEPEDKEKYLIKDGDIVVSRAGSVGVSYLISNPEPSVFASYLIRFKPLIDRKYVYYFLKCPAYWNAISEKSAGIALQNVNASKLKEIDIPVAPPEQQKRIVAKIEELFSHIDAGTEALKKAKQLLKQYRQSVLKAAVTGEITKEWREANKDKLEPASQLLERILKERREKWEEQQLEQFKAKGKMPKDDKWKAKYNEPEGAVVDNLPEIPNEWVWATLPQMGELNRGKSKHRPRNDPSLYGGDYPFVQTGDVRAANTWLKEYSQTYSDKGLAQSRLWPKGTMCITIAANIADTAILELDACFPDSVVGFIPLNDSVNVEVVEFFIRTVKSDLEKYAPATAQKNINLEILETVAIPLLPIDEQKELLNSLKYKMSMADRLEKEIDHQLIKTEKNKQSVLASAFTGKL